jgi:hypothetical protein
MKTTNWVLAILAVLLLALAGCRKSEQRVAPPREFFGVKVDLPRLDADFTDASPDVQDSVSLIKQFFRYGQFPQAMVELNKLSNTPNLTKPQKKLVNDLLEQTKQVVTKAPPPPGQ